MCVIFSSSGSLRMRLISQFSRASGARFSETDDSPETVVGRWILPAKLKALLGSSTILSQVVAGKDFMVESKSPLFGIAPGEQPVDDPHLYYPGKKDHHKRVTTERPHPTGGAPHPAGVGPPPGRTRKGEVDSDSLFRVFRWIPWLIADSPGAAIGCCWTESAVRIRANLGCRGNKCHQMSAPGMWWTGSDGETCFTKSGPIPNRG